MSELYLHGDDAGISLNCPACLWTQEWSGELPTLTEVTSAASAHHCAPTAVMPPEPPIGCEVVEEAGAEAMTDAEILPHLPAPPGRGGHEDASCPPHVHDRSVGHATWRLRAPYRDLSADTPTTPSLP